MVKIETYGRTAKFWLKKKKNLVQQPKSVRKVNIWSKRKPDIATTLPQMFLI